MIDVDIGPITWSNHAPVSLTLNLGPVPTRICHWRLNESLLKKKQLREEIERVISDYFITNEGSVSSQVTLWEEHKAVIRGQCIAIGSKIKRDVVLQVESLNSQLSALELKLASRPSRRTLRRILNIRSKLKTLALGRTEKLLLYSHQRFYERAKKAHTLLADMLRAGTVWRTPHAWKNNRGMVIHDPTAIANIFHAFFTKLYSLSDTLPANPCDRCQLLDNVLSLCSLPKFSDEALTLHKSPIIADEIEEVLKALPSGKAPGPDALTNLYYQTFPSLLIPRMAT